VTGLLFGNSSIFCAQTSMCLQPMVELLAYLRANGFKTYVASAGGVEFMRPRVQKAYGVPPEQIIGVARSKPNLRL
jgi:phosphoserine phosphatase